jgi:DNA polymerase (family X)
MTNREIAHHLELYARQLEAEGAMLYRVRAYRRAVAVVQAHPRELEVVVSLSGRSGLEAIPGIGKSLAYSIEMLLSTGRLHTLRPVDGHRHPTGVLLSLPGVGHRLAEQLHDRLGVRTLEDLERAADEGRLAELGIGSKRLRVLLDSLATRLRHARHPEEMPEPAA